MKPGPLPQPATALPKGATAGKPTRDGWIRSAPASEKAEGCYREGLCSHINSPRLALQDLQPKKLQVGDYSQVKSLCVWIEHLEILARSPLTRRPQNRPGQMVRSGTQPTPTPPSWHTMGAMNVQRLVSGSYISTELRLDCPSYPPTA